MFKVAVVGFSHAFVWALIRSMPLSVKAAPFGFLVAKQNLIPVLATKLEKTAGTLPMVHPVPAKSLVKTVN